MSYEVLSDKEPKARKVHGCIWCGEAIPVGETYHAQAGLFEDRYQTSKYHLDCWQAAHAYRGEGYDFFMPRAFRRGTMEER